MPAVIGQLSVGATARLARLHERQCFGQRRFAADGASFSVMSKFQLDIKKPGACR